MLYFSKFSNSAYIVYAYIIRFAVVILCVRGTLVRKCMLAAHKLGMTKGDWVFLDVELVQVRIIKENISFKLSCTHERGYLYATAVVIKYMHNFVRYQ